MHMFMSEYKYDFKKTAIAIGISLVFLFALAGCNMRPENIVEDALSAVDGVVEETPKVVENKTGASANDLELFSVVNPEKSEFPDFSGTPVIEINGNIPEFKDFEPFKGILKSFEYYPELDIYGRCGACYAILCSDLMPVEERGKIGHIKPSGWQTVKYDFVDGLYLYNRCHLIGYQLTGENDNVNNLITGTRYMNTEGMLSYENMVANYIRETENHVFYRITPIYSESDPVAKGVQMEAFSVEDEGAGICFNVFVYNIQPGVRIDYSTGESYEDESVQVINEHAGDASDYDYVFNISSTKFHYGDCQSVTEMKEYNKEYFKGSREDAIELGYKPCGSCKP